MPLLLRLIAALLAVVYVGNGLTMLWDPEAWYAAVPGVTATGPMNPHFIRDIGFAYAASGAAALAVLLQARNAAIWALVSAVWPGLHALFHIYNWSHHGMPAGEALTAEIAGVIVPAALGLYLAFAARRRAAS